MISFRFDIDTRRGLVERVPPLLDLLGRFGVRATFFCVMGREANLAEIVRLRLLADRSTKSPLNVGAKGGLVSIAKAALLPRAVGYRNGDRLREIIDRGHELEPHGWSHIQWQRSIDHIDVRKHLGLALDHYQRVTGRPAAGFASPGRTWNGAALHAFDEAGLLYVGDMDGTAPFRPPGHSHVQLPITRFETMAEMRRRGLDDSQIVDTYVADLEHDYCCFYEHPDDVGDRELAVFERLFQHVQAKHLEPVTLQEIARA